MLEIGLLGFSIITFILGFYVGRREVHKIKKELEEYKDGFKKADEIIIQAEEKATVSYTHLTLPTNREV